MDGLEIIEQYQYAEYRRKRRNNWVARVWVLSLATTTVIALIVSALVW